MADRSADKYGFMILPDGKRYSLDDRQTRLNNNVLVVGTTGAAKNRILRRTFWNAWAVMC